MEEPRSGSVPLTNGSESSRPKNRRIRIRNTASEEFYWERRAGVQGKGESKKEAKEAAAKAMLQQIGPYIEDEEWVKYVMECQMKENGTTAGGYLYFSFHQK